VNKVIEVRICHLVTKVISIWAYDLKLLADESIGGNMLSVVENELEDWIKNENSN
jgi:hypothetical protein